MSADALRTLIEQIVDERVTRILAERTPATTPKLLTVAAYATTHSISPSTVRAEIRKGRLHAVKIGRAVRIPSDAEIAKPIPRSHRVEVDTPAARADRVLARLGGGR